MTFVEQLDEASKLIEGYNEYLVNNSLKASEEAKDKFIDDLYFAGISGKLSILASELEKLKHESTDKEIQKFASNMINVLTKDEDLVIQA